jgi:predicted GIY-YIG superfamily endonuclease
MTNHHRTVLYTGVTGDLITRGWQHRNGLIDGFTNRYNLTRLVYLEEYRDVREAIAREKQLKGWSRKKKEALINRLNPQWRDLYPELLP